MASRSYLMQILFYLVGLTCELVAAFDSLGIDTQHSIICQQIDKEIPDRISYPSSSAYDVSLESYFSEQEMELRPSCIFSPKNSSDVSRFVKLMGFLRQQATHTPSPPRFAIRGGGHTPWSGAANINDGISMDLRGLDSVVLSHDQRVVSLGGGAIWSDIYPQLIPYNLTVMGGRVVGVGVGGYLTGGGISVLSRSHGWSCDQVYGYEIVLGSGEIVYATSDSHPDLWLAMKGGSNNFGIVTRFELPTWPLWKLWGGALSFNYTPAAVQAHTNAFSHFMDPANFDSDASMFFALFYRSKGVGRSILDVLFYTRPIAQPTIFNAFTSIPNLTANTLRLANISNIISEQPGNLPSSANRAVYMAFSFQNPDSDVYQELINIWEDFTGPLENIEGLEVGLLFQPQPVSNGTNSLGLEAGDTNVVLAALTASYTRKSDDDKLLQVLTLMRVRMEGVLRRNDVYIPFQYLNYAHKTQAPIESYGQKSRARLQEVSKKYDSEGVFQTLVPGGFKLFP